MREALLKLVGMALRDGYLSDDILELINKIENMEETDGHVQQIKEEAKEGTEQDGA